MVQVCLGMEGRCGAGNRAGSGFRAVLKGSAGFGSATRAMVPVGATRATRLFQQEATRSHHPLPFRGLPPQLVESDPPSGVLDHPKGQPERTGLRLRRLAAHGGLEGREVHLIVFLATFPAGLAG